MKTLLIQIPSLCIFIASVAEANDVWEHNEVDWIELPNGSRWIDHKGMDSSPGVIRRPLSQDIRFDIGFMAGSYVNPDRKDTYQWKKDHAWYREQYSKLGHFMCIAMKKKHKTMIISFPKFSSNFYVPRVKDAQIERIIGIVSTYDPNRYMNRKRTN